MIARLLCLSMLCTLLTAEVTTPDALVAKGLAALERLQQEDGSFGRGTGVTALAGMAFLAGGHTPTRGAYRNASAKCLQSVLAGQDPVNGYLGDDSGNMYAHGFATLYLAECYGMTGERKVRVAMEAALDLIFRAQNDEGGWRYTPFPNEADISVTICQVMAIRAAYNVGVGGDRAQEVMRKAVEYVRACANPDGSFNYQARGGSFGREGYRGVPRASAGAMCLIGAGITDPRDPVLGPALGFVRKHVPAHLRSGGDWYWYGQYYASQLMFHSPDQSDWETYWNVAWPVIAEYQDANGYWSRPDGYGPAFGTAMALIILQIPNNYLPIFQR